MTNDRSSVQNLVLTKILLPLVCISASLVFIRTAMPVRTVLLAAPFLLLAFFFLSLAIVEVSGTVMRYRRLFKWTPLEQDEISAVRVEWSPLIASIQTSKYLFPWGKLYFVLDDKSNLNPFGKGEFPLVKRLSNRPHPSAQAANAAQDKLVPGVRLKLRFVLAAIAGFTLETASQMLTPRRGSIYTPTSSQLPYWISSVLRATRTLESPEAVFGFAIVFICAALLTYRRRSSWIFAFLSGSSVAYLSLYFIATLRK